MLSIMTARQVVRRLEALGAVKVRQKGSHARFQSACGRCNTTVPMHAGEDIGPGLLRKIEKDMAPCYGDKWLRG